MSQYEEVAQSVDVARYWRVVRRRWFFVGLCVALGVAGGILYSALAPAKVTATSIVNINVISTQPFSNVAESSLIDPPTEVALAHSSEVLSDAQKSMSGGATPAELRANTTIVAVPDATVIKISFTASTKSAATTGADAIAAAYLSYRQKAAQKKVDDIGARLSKRETELSDKLSAANAKLNNAASGSSAAIQAASDRDVANIELNALTIQINQLQGVDVQGGTLISDAADNPVTVAPSKVMPPALGLVIGLLIGMGAAFLVNALDHRLYDAYQLARSGGGELLGALTGRAKQVPGQGEDLETLRRVRERLMTRLRPGSTLSVIDIGNPGGAPDVAVNLALCYAESAYDVRLVLPGLPSQFVQQVEQRLTEIFAERALPGSIDVVATGGAASSKAAPNLESVLEATAETDREYGLTLISVPHSASRSSRLESARLAHSVVLVASRLGTRIQTIRTTAMELTGVHADVLGTVLTPKRPRSTSQQVFAAPRSSAVPKAGRDVRAARTPAGEGGLAYAAAPGAAGERTSVPVKGRRGRSGKPRPAHGSERLEG